MLLASSGYLVLIAVLGASGLTKLRHPRVFAGQIEGYRLVPRRLVMPVAAALALIETGCAVLLAAPGSRRAGLLIAGGLVGVFLLAMAVALARGQRIPCGCFGATGALDTVGMASLLRTALLAVIIVAALTARPTALRPASALVAALMLILVFLTAETARLLPAGNLRPAGERRLLPACPETSGPCWSATRRRRPPTPT